MIVWGIDGNLVDVRAIVIMAPRSDMTIPWPAVGSM